MTGTIGESATREPVRVARRGAARFGLRPLLALVAVVGVAGAACGSTGAATQIPRPSVEAALLAFSRCMRAQGITDMPDPTVDSEGNVRIERPPGGHGSGAHDAFEAARNTCDKFLRGVTQGFSHADSAQIQDRLLKLAQCMRRRGADVPDPDFSQGGHDPGARFRDAINRSDPAVQQARRACQQQVFGSQGVGHSGGH
jgi:hypothetical protein